MNLLEKGSKFARLAARRRSRLPEEVQLEVTNRCNLSCRMCPRTRWGMPLVDMPYEVFEAVLARLPGSTRSVTLTGWGEPLLHPRLFDMARAVRASLPRARVRYTTNGTFLDERRRRETIESGIRQVSLSADIGPSEGELAGMAHPEEEKPLEQLALLAKEARGAGRPLDLYLQAVVVSRAEGRLESLIRFAAEHRLSGIHLARLQPMGQGAVERPSFEEERSILLLARRLGRAHGVRVWSAIDHSLPMKWAGRFDALCLRTDDYLYVDVNGQATPCCSLWHLKMGDLTTGDLASIWRSERWDAFFARQQEACGDCDALKHRPLPSRPRREPAEAVR